MIRVKEQIGYFKKVQQLEACAERRKEIKAEKRDKEHKEGSGFSDLFHAAVDAIIEERSGKEK